MSRVCPIAFRAIYVELNSIMSLRNIFIGCLLFLAPHLRRPTACCTMARQDPDTASALSFLPATRNTARRRDYPCWRKSLPPATASLHGAFLHNPATGVIDPNCQTNLPGIEALDTADLCVMLLRFRELPDAKMKHFVDYLNAGKPIIALRTSTHAFSYQRNTNSPYARYDWNSSSWPGGFGRQVLGDTWISHHGEHGVESTRGVINQKMKDHPILRGVTDLWWPTDVYTVAHLPPDAQVLVWGQVLSGMKPSDSPVTGLKNDPLMPLLWVRDYKGDSGKVSKIVATTAGAAVDLQNEGLRRMLVNACYWTLGLEDKIPASADVSYVGQYSPSSFGFGGFKKGVKPADLAPPIQ